MDTDTILRVLPLPLSLSRSWLQFDSEGLRRWIPRRPSLERGEEGEKSRTEWTGSTTSFPPTPANSTVLIYLRTFSSPFPSSFLDRCDALFPPSLSPLLQRGRSKATLCSFRKAACSTTFTIRRNAGNLTGKQTGREDEATWEYRFTCSPHRNSILVGAWFTGVPGSMSCVRKVSVISDRMNFLRFFSIFLSSSFFLNLFATT